jgi:phospholipase C
MGAIMAGNLLFDHFVVLMLENRSFDHLFGYLGKGEGLPAGGGVNYLTPGDDTTTAFTSREGGDFVCVGKNGPEHTLKETNLQLFGTYTPAPGQAPAMSGFAASFNAELARDLKRTPTASEVQQVMNVFDPVQLPVLSTLAKAFVLCDHWHADVPGPTMPNRAFVHAATAQGYTWNAGWKPQFTCDTLYHRINATQGRSWRSYHHDQDDILELYPYLPKDQGSHVTFDTFATDVAGDNLATYSFITPAFMGPAPNSMHAPKDVRPAEKLVADVYSALAAHPDVWKKTLLIVLFDEHGGYFDHVAPPTTVSPDNIPGRTDQPFLVPFDFKRLGLRVPAILISPWFEAAVDSTQYSHCSIPGSIIDALELTGGFLTERDKGAAKLTGYFIDDGTRVWRDDVPVLTVPVQPQALDQIQSEILEGAVHLDPHPQARDVMRVRDIQDPGQAGHFVRVQMAKHLEHYFASGGRPDVADKLSADNQQPSTSPSPARIVELAHSQG